MSNKLENNIFKIKCLVLIHLLDFALQFDLVYFILFFLLEAQGA